MGPYRRLLGFLRPHAWRMSAAIASNIVASVLDAFAFTLLIPFLNALFGQQELIPVRIGLITNLQRWILGAFMDASHPMDSLKVDIRDDAAGKMVWVQFENFYTGISEKLPKA